jgi:indole-3-glycerol phosphate synthase
MSDARRPPDILARIVTAERDVLERSRRARPLTELKSAPAYHAARRSLVASLRQRRPGVIAECKRRSPSKGVLREPYDPVAIARGYEAAGAAGLSVLTNEEFFGGSLADLTAVRGATSIPILRKDFVIDGYQIEEARAAGADVVLLIAAVLSPAELRDLSAVSREVGLETLIEIHDEDELESAVDAAPDLVGINNRDLRTFTTDLATTERLRPRLPGEAIVVAESGLRDGRDLARLMSGGVDAFLVGEAFMTAPDPGRALAAMIAGAEAP